jgi:hypothetical protein
MGSTYQQRRCSGIGFTTFQQFGIRGYVKGNWSGFDLEQVQTFLGLGAG